MRACWKQNAVIILRPGSVRSAGQSLSHAAKVLLETRYFVPTWLLTNIVRTLSKGRVICWEGARPLSVIFVPSVSLFSIPVQQLPERWCKGGFDVFHFRPNVCDHTMKAERYVWTIWLGYYFAYKRRIFVVWNRQWWLKSEGRFLEGRPELIRPSFRFKIPRFKYVLTSTGGVDTSAQ